jgi:cyclohexanecarboxylate-CoA ligase
MSAMSESLPELAPVWEGDYYSQGWWRREVFLDDLAARAARTPDEPAYTNERRYEGETVTVTFSELADHVERLAAVLRARGATRGRVVAFQLANLWETAALWLACGRAGAVAASVPPWIGQRERELILAGTRPVLLVCMDGEESGVAGIVDVVGLGELMHQAGSVAGLPAAECPPARADDVCQVSFTSGTTGRPKAVVHTFNTRYAGLCAAMRQLPRDAVTAAAADLTHSVGLMFNALAPLATGRRSVFLSSYDPDAWLDLLAMHRVNCFVATPVVLRELISAQRRHARNLSCLRQVISVGAPIPPPIAAEIRAVLAHRLVNGFGMTESGMLLATSPDTAHAEDSLGYPVAGVQVRLQAADGTGSGATIGASHLHVRAPGLCRGTFDLRTRERVWDGTCDDGWYDTGDLVQRDGQGRLRYLSRADDRIGNDIVIPVTEVEGELLGHPAVAEVAIVGVPDASGYEVACAIVVPRASVPSLASLRAYLSGRHMTESYLPERVAVVAALPRTALGKVCKGEIQRQVAAGIVVPEGDDKAARPVASARVLGADWERVQTMLRFIVEHTTSSALRAVLPPREHAVADSVLSRHVRFDHGALLVFPATVDAAVTELSRQGMSVSAPLPSTVVRGRLAERYDLAPQELPVTITRARSPKSPEHTLELFLLPAHAAQAQRIISDERAHQHESHLAFRVLQPVEHLLDRVWNAVVRQTELTADGGGFNPYHGRSGCTVLYFRSEGQLPRPYSWPRRLEIIADGHHQAILHRHLQEPQHD